MADLHSMKPELYKQMRINILQTAFSGVSKSPFPSDYLYAWYAGVYPCLSKHRSLHEPYSGFFHIKPEQAEQVFHYLDDIWQRGETVGFSRVEQHFERMFTEGEWTRSELIDTCRYLYLTHHFDEAFWKVLLGALKNDDAALRILEELQAEELHLLGDLISIN